jgi:DNA-binding transcriptional LysR family regulator
VPKDSVAATTASRQLLIEMVAAGVGVGLLPDPLVADRTDVVEVPGFRSKTALLTRNAWLLYVPELKNDARVRAVLPVLARHLGRLRSPRQKLV